MTIEYRLLRGRSAAPSFVIDSAIANRRSSVKTGSFRGRLGVILGSFWGRFGVDLGSVWGRFGVGLGSVYYHGIVMTETSTPGPATSYRSPHPAEAKKHAFGPRNTISCHEMTQSGR